MSPPRSRILMTADAVGGVWTFATTLARELCGKGSVVHLVTLGQRPNSRQLDSVSGDENLTIEITDLALEWMDPDGRDIPRARDVLGGAVERFRPDTIHLNSYREAAFNFDAAVVVTAHSCVASWWQACRGGSPNNAWQEYLRNIRAGLNAADAWTAPTAAYRDWIEAAHRPHRKGHAIWNGATLDRAETPKQQFILAAGRLWDEAKSISELTRIAGELDWPVRVAGATQLPQGILPVSVEAPNVQYLGELPQPQLMAQMQRAAIFVSPARYEPFGLTALEAASCRCALVLSDIPTLRELWDGAALFVEAGNASALAEALRRLCRDHDLRAEFQRASCERAHRYPLSATVERYRALYRAASAAKRTARSAPALELCA